MYSIKKALSVAIIMAMTVMAMTANAGVSEASYEAAYGVNSADTIAVANVFSESEINQLKIDYEFSHGQSFNSTFSQLSEMPKTQLASTGWGMPPYLTQSESWWEEWRSYTF